MAGEDKKEKSGGSEGGGGSGFSDAIFWILLVLVFFYILGLALKYLNIFQGGAPDVTAIFSAIFDTYQVISIFLCLVFFIGIIYFNFLISEIMHRGHGGHGVHGHGDEHHAEIVKEHEPNKRWQNVVERISSQNESDWRLAIIEADIILGDMLDRMGYPGESIAEKLKKIERSDFETLDKAWEAHKIRNEIAHSGSDFNLSKNDAEKAIRLFKEVFEEFYFI